tara:strand:+ start:907 stop:1926 length:1020 start_codon:yes stop_codon:yes gene_type:complete
MLRQTDIILAIESSCDDTAAAVLKDRKVLSNCVANQNLIHKAYGGIVPELASRAHQSKIIPVVSHALTEANIDKKELTAIAYTQGPGLLGSLLVGSSFAKSLSIALNIPLLPINHMQGHLLAHFIEDENFIPPDFPFLGVTLSGGHTQLILVKEYFKMELIGTSLDDAIGEAFDKCGKRMGLNYPAGHQIDKLAKDGDHTRFKFPINNLKGYNVSYSGVKTSFTNFIQKQKDPKFITKNLNDLCASLQYTLIQIILIKIEKAVQDYGINQIVIGGGVAANSEIRKQLNNIAKSKNWKVFLPSIAYSTDNAAMIGIAGYYKLLQKNFGRISDSPQARLKI